MDILYLNSRDIETLALTDAEIIGAIEESLRAQGNTAWFARSFSGEEVPNVYERAQNTQVFLSSANCFAATSRRSMSPESKSSETTSTTTSAACRRRWRC